MKITAFNGSMRGRKSNTTVMVEAFLEGANSAGATTEHIFLVEKKIRHCRGCFHCWVDTPGVCIHQDDMKPLLEKFLGSDVVVIASPVYVENVTGITKVFIDRLVPMTDPHFALDEDGASRHVSTGKYPGFLAISNSGFVEQSSFEVLRVMFRRLARSIKAELLGEIYRGGGAILTLKDPALQPLIDDYKTLLHRAGTEVATDKRLSEATRIALEEQPWIPTELYNAQVNQLWDRLIAKHQRERT